MVEASGFSEITQSEVASRQTCAYLLVLIFPSPAAVAVPETVVVLIPYQVILSYS
jgi:hypothetical protein